MSFPWYHKVYEDSKVPKHLCQFFPLLTHNFPMELWIIQTWNIFFQQFQKPCTMWCVWETECIHQCDIFLKNVCSNGLFIWLMYAVWICLHACVWRETFYAGLSDYILFDQFYSSIFCHKQHCVFPKFSLYLFHHRDDLNLYMWDQFLWNFVVAFQF